MGSIKCTYFVYIISNYLRTTFYIGMTNNLRRRINEHRSGVRSRFAPSYCLRYLVYYEEYADVADAMKREKQLKHWHRQWKLEIIRKVNPEMVDLSDKISLSNQVRPPQQTWCHS